MLNILDFIAEGFYVWISDLFPNTAYEFRICGYNELGEGALSKSITVTSDGE